MVVSIFTSTSHPLCHFLSLILGTALSPYPGDVISEWSLILFYNFRSELHTHILLFRLLPFFWVQYAFFYFSYFLPKSILSLKVTKWKVLLQFLYLVKQVQIQFYQMETDFCAWLISIGKYHFAQKLHWFRYESYP